jgi:hypothetical protein
VQAYVSAWGDKAIHRFELDGSTATGTSVYLQEQAALSGLTADTKGRLYYMLARDRVIKRINTTTGKPEVVATDVGAAGQELAKMVFGPDGKLYAIAGPSLYQVDVDSGKVTLLETIAGERRLSVIVFDRDGSLLLGGVPVDRKTAHNMYRLAWPPDKNNAVLHVNPSSLLDPQTIVNPWNLGAALGEDGLMYVGVFPATNWAGLIYRIEANKALTKLLDLAAMQKDVPLTKYAGIHGLSFGCGGNLYFVNQNSSGSNEGNFGQLLRCKDASCQSVSLVGDGMYLDFPLGVDGDLIISKETVGAVSTAVDDQGLAEATIDVPDRKGCHEVRALLTDPRTGAIFEARASVSVE